MFGGRSYALTMQFVLASICKGWAYLPFFDRVKSSYVQRYTRIYKVSGLMAVYLLISMSGVQIPDGPPIILYFSRVTDIKSSILILTISDCIVFVYLRDNFL
jgi:hypothetical protein